MADPIPEERTLIYPQETDYRSSVSQALLYKLGAMLNFLNKRHIETKRFQVNGNYGPAVIGALPFLAIDGAEPFLFNAEIVNIFIWNRIKGSAGTTSLDLKWKAKGGVTWESVFAGAGGVLPSFGAAASNYDMCGIGEAVTGFTAAKPNKIQFNSGDQLRMDLISSMTGNPNGAELIVFYRPR